MRSLRIAVVQYVVAAALFLVLDGLWLGVVAAGFYDRLLGIEIGHCGEEVRRHRDDALMSALAFGDEHPALADAEVVWAQPQHLAAGGGRRAPWPRPWPGPGPCPVRRSAG